MATREDLEGWLIEALTLVQGRGSIVEICKKIGENHQVTCRVRETSSTHGSTMSDGPRIDFVVKAE